MYNNMRTHAYVIQAEKDIVNVVTEKNKIETVRPNQIDKKLVVDRKTTTKDTFGQMIQLEDVIKVSDTKSRFYGYKGIIKSICKACIFLYEPVLLKTSSYGIFAE